jgi:putative drug exporter of the RND superfamily
VEVRAALTRIQEGGARRRVSGRGWAVAGFVHRPASLNAAGDIAVIEVLPRSSPEDSATQQLVVRLRSHVLPPTTPTGAHAYVGGSTASFIDISHRLSSRLILFIATVVALSFLLLTCVFRSTLCPSKPRS